MGKWRDQTGITFITVMFVVSIIGIMLAMTGQSWSRLMKREREEELLFRGMQVFKAISTWHRMPPGAKSPTLNELKDLMKDPRSLANVRYLRGDPSKKDPPSSSLLDPVTGKEFEPIKLNGKIIGVKSTSDIEPIKQGNFPPELKHLEEKKKYSDWLFVPGKFRSQLPQVVDTSKQPGKFDMGSPFLPDEKDKPKTK